MTIKGIVIKSLDYKETSKIVYLYTKQGIISVKALGAKKLKNGLMGFSTTLNYVEAIITDTGLKTLIDYTLLDAHSDLKSDLKKTLWLNYLLELTYKLPSDINHERCFLFLMRILKHARDNKSMLLLVILYQLKITRLFGVMPNFDDSAYKYFSLKEAKFMPSKTSLSLEESQELKKLYYFNDQQDDFLQFQNLDLLRYFSIINEYYTYHVDIIIKGLNSVIFD